MNNRSLAASPAHTGLIRLSLAVAMGLGFAACSGPTPPSAATASTELEAEEELGDISGSGPSDTAAPADAGGDTGTGTATCAEDKDCAGKVTLDLCQRAVCTAGKCAKATADKGTACDDKQLCTADDRCSGNGHGLNACTGTVSCKAPEGKDPACVISKCADDGSGACQYASAVAGTACDDGNSCTVQDACQAGGKCASAEAKACKDDGNSCTQETCDAKTGECSSVLVAEGSACSDGNACTAEDTCSAAGACTGVAVTCNASPSPCAIAFCDPNKGCSIKGLSDGTPCDDNDACTSEEKCVQKACVGNPDLIINDNNPCTLDAGEGKNSSKCKISNTPQDGAPCDDGEPCTKSDVCKTGACKGTDLVCNDGNPCTSDQCDPSKCADIKDKTTCGQCVSPAMKDGSPCDDNNKCTSKDLCTTGKCVGVDLLLTGGCDDKNPCTSDGCQPGAGCLNVPNAGAVCSDGDPCTEVDKCQSTVCKGTPRDCKDNDPCTTDTCDSKIADMTKACIHTPYDGPCDDGNACKSEDTCKGGVCAGSVTLVCDDGLPCTVDTCESNFGCKFKPAPGGSACDDGVSCTVGDYCDSGKCVAQKDTCVSCSGDLACKAFDDSNLCNGVVKCIDAGAKGKVCAVEPKTVVKCDASNDTPCGTNTCDPDTGVCSANILAEGTPCKGSDKCQTGTACSVTGQCVGKTLNCDDKNDCTTEACDPALGCKFTPRPDNVPCDDGSLCTPGEGDKCSAGQCINPVNTCKCTVKSDCKIYEGKDGDLCNEKWDCVPSPSGSVCKPLAGTETVCDLSKDEPCTVSTCEKLSGQCKPVTLPDSALCDDGNVCTVGDFCKLGVCAKSKDLNCDDSNPCTFDVCDVVFGCANAPKVGAGSCDDGDKCTGGDTCVTDPVTQEAVCQGKKTSCDDFNPCTVDSCGKNTGCANQIDNTLGCDDGDPCTGKDLCKDGVCAGPVLNCDDKNTCTIDVCDGKGGCQSLVIDGKDCNDGDLCTAQDVCKANQCIGVAKNCDDANQCTQDSCMNGSCLMLAKVGATCDDGNACTTEDLCDNKGGCTGKSYTCAATTPCVAYPQGCLATKGCLGVNNDGIACNDGDACTQWSGALPNPDHCLGGACTGLPVTCDDKNICTNDLCDKQKGCLITQNTCDDQNPCTTDICEKAQGCQHTSLDGSMCDDGDACTQATHCLAGKCLGSAIQCDDKNGCTADSCDIKLGCVFLPAVDTQVSCDDGDVCTDDSCKDGTCVGAAKQCDDDNPCTQDSCDTLKGCVKVDLAEGTACDDGDSCTDATQCLSGQCAGGTVGKGCYACKVTADCDPYDNNNKCDGVYTCKASAVSGLSLCYFDPIPVFCDSLSDSACKTNQCQSATGKCAMTELLNGSQCEDGQGCTAGDFCLNGACKAGGPTDCSKAGDPCNDATCQETGKFGEYTCVTLPKAGTPTCDADKDGCTFNDVCIAGTCTAGAKVDCAGVAKECETATCKSTGPDGFQCLTAPSKDGSPCDDKQLCTNGDFCKTGKCQAGTEVHDCGSLSSTCADGLCDKTGNGGLGACVPKPKNEGSPCDSDGNGCTVGDKCVAGACVAGAPPDCSAKTSSCTVGACASSGASTFTCMGAPKKNGLPCDADNNGCTVADACKAGKCLPGAAMDCSAKDSMDGCQLGVCKAPAGLAAFCDVGFAPKQQPCDSDGSGCTLGDVCNGQGACQPGKAVDCLGVTTGCAQGTCTSTGSTTYTCKGDPKPDGAKCDADINGCTLGDQCMAGKCVPGPAIDCSAELQLLPTACTTPKCFSTGSETHACDNSSNKDGTTCDADGKGCTVGDSCQLGFCTPGPAQTCSAVAGLCATVSCEEVSPTSYKCLGIPKDSYPPLDPPEPCTPTVSPDKCAAGYNCMVLNKDLNTGTCTPSVTINCSDGDPCTAADVCVAGVCKSGKPLNCNDEEPCTLDYCSQGNCVNLPVAGCTPCMDEKFDNPMSLGWIATETDDSDNKVPYLLWKVSDKQPYAGETNMRAEWQGPGPASAKGEIRTMLLSRQYYIQDSQAATLEFHIYMDVGTQECGQDDLQLLINHKKVWERCSSVQYEETEINSIYTKASVDLSKYAGAPVDIEFVAVAGTGGANKGIIDLDSVRMTGACSLACAGASFEPTEDDDTQTPVDLVAQSIPQPWRVLSTDVGYVGFAPVASVGHSGIGFLEASWSGKPASGKQETARLTIPKIEKGSSNKLWFALRAPKVGDEGCGSDDFVVKMAGKEVFRRCNSLANWQTFSLDLPGAVTLDVEMSVVTGLDATSAGTWQLDDIAVSGTCQWACFYDNFDSGGFAASWDLPKGKLTGWKPWAISTSQSVSPTGSMYAGYTAAQQPVDGKTNIAIAKGRVGPMPMGGVWSYNFNMSYDSPACLPTEPVPPFPNHAFRILVKDMSAGPSMDDATNLFYFSGKYLDKDGNVTVDTLCRATSGFEQRSGEMPWKGWPLRGRVMVVASKQPVDKVQATHIDDLLIMCR